MGRGRAKAKQTKVARELKYNSGGFDANRLSHELGVSPSTAIEPEPIEDDEDDPYAAYADLYADEDEDDEDSADNGHSRRRA
ncbi:MULTISPECIES: DUF3073 domain-containing protein [Kitasatospora]|uniref:DUF3073 domain-containing protein n=1 Tax=Kitasatospora arboriphila TaxID=258052 RepID=A0ABP4E5X9_9ACTN|nr:DUF3073 domain-containing protein [Kitasatospora sp. DSM 101779]MCU7823515.1 DUF3073 domain-containing protein [Kitasatospora sp. DSM 101779]